MSRRVIYEIYENNKIYLFHGETALFFLTMVFVPMDFSMKIFLTRQYTIY